MHVFGLLTCCSTLKEMDEVVCSSAVLFCSPCSGANLQKHYNNLQMLMQQRGSFEHEKDVIAEDYRVLKIMLILQDLFFSTQPHSYNAYSILCNKNQPDLLKPLVAKYYVCWVNKWVKVKFLSMSYPSKLTPVKDVSCILIQVRQA